MSKESERARFAFTTSLVLIADCGFYADTVGIAAATAAAITLGELQGFDPAKLRSTVVYARLRCQCVAALLC